MRMSWARPRENQAGGEDLAVLSMSVVLRKVWLAIAWTRARVFLTRCCSSREQLLALLGPLARADVEHHPEHPGARARASRITEPRRARRRSAVGPPDRTRRSRSRRRPRSPRAARSRRGSGRPDGPGRSTTRRSVDGVRAVAVGGPERLVPGDVAAGDVPVPDRVAGGAESSRERSSARRRAVTSSTAPGEASVLEPAAPDREPALGAVGAVLDVEPAGPSGSRARARASTTPARSSGWMPAGARRRPPARPAAAPSAGGRGRRARGRRIPPILLEQPESDRLDRGGAGRHRDAGRRRAARRRGRVRPDAGAPRPAGRSQPT